MDIDKIIQKGYSCLVASNGCFLGKLSLSPYDSESISNKYGIYGSIYAAYSIWNKYGMYGSPYSVWNPYNAYTTTPPVIYLRGRKYGYLSKNKYLLNCVDPDSISDWMKRNNLY